MGGEGGAGSAKDVKTGIELRLRMKAGVPYFGAVTTIRTKTVLKFNVAPTMKVAISFL